MHHSAAHKYDLVYDLSFRLMKDVRPPFRKSSRLHTLALCISAQRCEHAAFT